MPSCLNVLAKQSTTPEYLPLLSPADRHPLVEASTHPLRTGCICLKEKEGAHP